MDTFLLIREGEASHRLRDRKLVGYSHFFTRHKGKSKNNVMRKKIGHLQAFLILPSYHMAQPFTCSSWSLCRIVVPFCFL